MSADYDFSEPEQLSTRVAAGPAMKPCGDESPHRPITKIGKHKTVLSHVECNRLAGHDGNHSYSTMKYARLYEWNRLGVVIR